MRRTKRLPHPASFRKIELSSMESQIRRASLITVYKLLNGYPEFATKKFFDAPNADNYRRTSISTYHKSTRTHVCGASPTYVKCLLFGLWLAKRKAASAVCSALESTSSIHGKSSDIIRRHGWIRWQLHDAYSQVRLNCSSRPPGVIESTKAWHCRVVCFLCPLEWPSCWHRQCIDALTLQTGARYCALVLVSQVFLNYI